MMSHSNAPGLLAADAHTATQTAVQLLCTVVPTLQRRMAAGTLLAGACRPTEEAWNAARLRHLAELNCPAEVAQGRFPLDWKAPFIGYEAYQNAAAMMLAAIHGERGMLKAGSAPGLVALVVSAVDLMTLPRSHCEKFMAAETLLFSTFEAIFADRSVLKGAPLHNRLLDAWHKMLRSNVHRERDLVGASEQFTARAIEWRTTETAQHASAVLRACALEACAAREVHAAQFKKCAACQAVVYCCKAHQEQHWPAHKASCKAARKAAAQGGVGPSARERRRVMLPGLRVLCRCGLARAPCIHIAAAPTPNGGCRARWRC